MSTQPFDTVVVIGGSIAGLLSAAAVHPHADRVVVVDRDRLPPRPQPRPGTPQALHSHGLLASGRHAMEDLLPGFTERMVEAGGIFDRDIGRAGRWWVGGGLLADCELGLRGIAASRPAIEHTLRELVRELPGIQILDEVDVAELRARRGRIRGVQVRRRDEAGGSREIEAGLVIDATGRSGRASRWLPQIGATAPREERITVGVRAGTVHVKAEDGDLDGRAFVVSAATPDNPRGGVAIHQEDRTWTITLYGYGEAAPPMDADSLRRHAERIVSPDIAGLLAGRELLHSPVSFRFPDCRRRRFEQLGDLPLGYAPIGDAICSFDPTFGQGMSVAALQAVALREAVADGPSAVRHSYPASASQVVDSAWAVVLGAVLGLPGVSGDRPRGHAAISRYIRRLQRVARHDPDVSRAFLLVTNLLAPPESLMEPAVAARVLRPVPSRAA